MKSPKKEVQRDFWEKFTIIEYVKGFDFIEYFENQKNRNIQTNFVLAKYFENIETQ